MPENRLFFRIRPRPIKVLPALGIPRLLGVGHEGKQDDEQAQAAAVALDGRELVDLFFHGNEISHCHGGRKVCHSTLNRVGIISQQIRASIQSGRYKTPVHK